MKATDNPVALVTGASRGIGRAIALALKKKGYNVVGLYKSNDLKAEELEAQGITMIKADVGNPAKVSTAIEKVADEHGGLDLVVNNAGIDIPGKIEAYATQTWNAMLATDLTSIFLVSKYAIPHLKKSND